MTASYVDHGNRHGPGGTDPIPAPGGASFEIKVVADDALNVVGDGVFKFDIPADLDGLPLTEVAAYVTTVSSSGKPTVQVRNVTDAVDMLATPLTVDVGEKNTKYAAVPAVINPANATVAEADEIAIDVDVAGTGAKGLGVILVFGSPPGGQGLIGPPGETGPAGPTGPPGADGADGADATGFVVTDTIWDAKGDLALGTGPNTGARLPVGTNGDTLVADSSQTTGVRWAAGGAGGGAATFPVTQTAHGLAVGNAVRYTGSAYVKAQADSAANAEVIGIVSAVAGANDFTLAVIGQVTGLSGLTAGTTYFLSPTTAGALTATEPTGVGQVSKPLLVAYSATAGYFYNWRGFVTGTSGGGGGLVLLEQHTAAASATLDFTSFISALYDDYVVELIGLVPATVNVDFYCRVSVAGVFQTGAAYVNNHLLQATSGNVSVVATLGQFATRNNGEITNNAAKPVTGRLTLRSPQSTTLEKKLQGNIYWSGGSNWVNTIFDGSWVTAASAVDGLRFLFSSGNIASGTIRVYGVAK